MTKLLEWLIGISVYAAVWISLVTGKIKAKVVDENMTLIYVLPLITVGLFGVSCLILVLWRVVTFNDCSHAALELQDQIKMARKDLSKKGLKFEE